MNPWLAIFLGLLIAIPLTLLFLGLCKAADWADQRTIEMLKNEAKNAKK